MNSTLQLFRIFPLKNFKELKKFCSHPVVSSVNVEFLSGLPHFRIPLPSRNENCLFILSPISQNVGDLIKSIKDEDGGVDRVAFFSKSGTRISKSNSIYSLLTDDFDLIINETSYPVAKPITESTEMQESVQRLADVRNIISQLSITVRTDEFNLQKERTLKKKEEELLVELQPLENQRGDIAGRAAAHTRRVTWLGLGAMGLQFGLLARLTWWEYSWDIMEPVTYFVGYGTAIAMYAYYVVTRQEYCFPQVFDRQYLKRFYSISEKNQFDVERYNDLREQLATVQSDQRRLRDPLLLNLPLQQLPTDRDELEHEVHTRHH